MRNIINAQKIKDAQGMYTWFMLAHNGQDVNTFRRLIELGVLPTRNILSLPIAGPKQPKWCYHTHEKHEPESTRDLLYRYTENRGYSIGERLESLNNCLSDTQCSDLQAVLLTNNAIFPALYMLLLVQAKRYNQKNICHLMCYFTVYLIFC